MGVFKKNGTWWIDYYDENDNRRRKKVGRSKKVAQDTLAEMTTQVRQKKLGIVQEVKAKPITVSDFLFHDCFQYFDTSLSVRTSKRYKSVVNHFSYFLRTSSRVKMLSQVRASHVEKYKTHRRTMAFPRGVSYFDKSLDELEACLAEAKENGGKVATESTVNFELQALRTVFNLAITWGYLAENPAKGIKKLVVTNSEKPRFLSQEEVSTLLERCSGEVQLVFRTFVLTGMRSGELMNLEWTDLDLGTGLIHIQKKMVNGEPWQPKWGHERNIPLHDELRPLLLKHQREYGERSGFVFCNSCGRQYSENGLRRELVRVTKNSELGDVTKIHSLRHTFGSQLVLNGVDLPTVQELMGHKDIETTMIYCHRTPDHLVKSVNRLGFR